MNIIYPARCPKCKEYNLIMAARKTDWGNRYFLACNTSGCWEHGPLAMTKPGAIRKWNRRAKRG